MGVTFETIKELIELKGWKARPIKPLGAQAWLLGFAERIDESWISWNEKMLLLTWDAEKKQKDVLPVLAGQQNIRHQAKQVTKPADDDPWGSYIRKTGSTPFAPANANTQASASRAREGPIEERFKEQDARINELRSTVNDMNKRLETAEESRSQFKKEVTEKFTEVQGQVKTQVETLSKHFDATLDRAMRRQDTQIENSFSELKALILNKLLPAKNARTDKPKRTGDDDQEEENW